MLDDALVALAAQEVPDAEAVEGLGAVVAQVVQEVEVEIPRARARKGGGQHALGLLRGLGAGPGGQLCRQLVGLPGVAVHQRGLDGHFALAAEVAVRRVKVGEALGEEEVDHLLGLLDVDVLADHGQAHQAEAELFDVLSERTHLCNPLVFC